MMDLFCLALAAAFFVITWFLLGMCESLLNKNQEERS